MSDAADAITAGAGPGRTIGPMHVLPDVASTAALATRLAHVARAGDVLALHGSLGTGKTVFARAFIQARLQAPVEVPSPTFTLVQVYTPDTTGDPEIYHVDLYRLGNAEEAGELGLDEAFAEAIVLIEWPERLGARLPHRRLDVRLAMAERGPGRCLALAGDPPWPERLQEVGLA